MCSACGWSHSAEDEMVTQTQKYLLKALLSAVVGLCLLINTGQSAVITATASPLQNATDGTTVPLRALLSHRLCREEHKHFCANGAQCRYPQDSEKPSCICTSLYQGLRCMEPVVHLSRTLPESQQVITISIGIIIFLILLAIGIYICVSKKCVKSTPLIKSAPSETSV